MRIDKKRYRRLVAEVLPHVSRSERENQACIARLRKMDAQKTLSPEERRLAELLAVIIEEFESRKHRIPSAPPHLIIRELMGAHGLRESDLLDVFGTIRATRSVLSGRQTMSNAHVVKLSRRFSVSPKLLLKPACDGKLPNRH